MKRLLLALVLLSSPALAYTKPPGVPTLLVENYGVTIGVWADYTAIGQGVGVFELQPNGTWTVCSNCIAQAHPSRIEDDIAYFGGLQGYISTVVPKVNTILARRFPAIGGETPPTINAIYQVNQLISNYRIENNGSAPVMVPK